MTTTPAGDAWLVVFTRQAKKDAQRVRDSGPRPRGEALLSVLAGDPMQTPPPLEKLRGDLAGAYSRRINIQHRRIYRVDAADRTVVVLRMWTHYE